MYASDLKHSSPALEEKLAHLYTLGKKTINQEFRQEYIDLLAAFGDPHKKLPPVIHVAGTNGKGSIVATLRSALEEGGYKVHTYTSPHLCAFNERIVLAGKQISDEMLESLIDEAARLNDSNDITFFEITTAMAFAAFSRVPADILLLEVGLGGRMDCTNIIEKPLVSIISSIGYDHTEFLGDTLAKIAAEKGGIIKQNIPVVISQQSPESAAAGTVKILSNMAEQKKSPLARSGAEWFTHDHGDMFKFVYKTVEMTLPHPNLQGTHQVTNAGAALAALQIIKDQFPVSETTLKSAMRTIRWSGRLQNLSGNSGKNFNLPQDWELWLDGGHNTDAAYALLSQCAQWNQDDGKKLHLILGMMNRKDPVKFAGILQKYLASVTCIDIPGEPQSLKAADMQSRLKKAMPDIKISSATDINMAAQTITETKEPGRILIAGSLYLAGDVLKSFGIRP